MVPTPEYLAIKDSPRVLLCETTRAIKQFVTFASMGGVQRHSPTRFLFTHAVHDILTKSLEDERKLDLPDSEDGTSEIVRYLDSEIRKLLESVKAKEKENKGIPYNEYSIGRNTLLNLAKVLQEDNISPYVPPNGIKFEEVRKELYHAQGVDPDGKPPKRSSKP